MPSSDKTSAAKEGFFKKAKITIYKGAPWVATSFFVFFGNLMLVDCCISLWWLTFFWAGACIFIAVDAAVIAIDLKVSEKRAEELANQLAVQKSISSQTLRKLDENHTLILEVRTMLAHNNHASFQYASYQSPQKNDHRRVRQPSISDVGSVRYHHRDKDASGIAKPASFSDIYAELALENEMSAPDLGIPEKNNVRCRSQYSRTSSLQ